MKIRLLIGTVCCLIGVVWLGQGVGLIGGSSMSGQAIWAVIGVLALLFGGAVLLGARRRMDQGPDD
jgi:hypothetical protein